LFEGGDCRTAIWRWERGVRNHVFKARGTSAEWNPLWAQLFLNSPVARAYFAFSAKQTTNLASINMTELKHCAFPLPPLAEQARIVTRVEELMRLCDALEAKGRLEAAQHAQLVTTLLATLTDSATPEALADTGSASPPTSTPCSTAPKPWTPWSKPSCNWPCAACSSPRTPSRRAGQRAAEAHPF
jgi:hypothetical protein